MANYETNSTEFNPIVEKFLPLPYHMNKIILNMLNTQKIIHNEEKKIINRITEFLELKLTHYATMYYHMLTNKNLSFHKTIAFKHYQLELKQINNYVLNGGLCQKYCFELNKNEPCCCLHTNEIINPNVVSLCEINELKKSCAKMEKLVVLFNKQINLYAYASMPYMYYTTNPKTEKDCFITVYGKKYQIWKKNNYYCNPTGRKKIAENFMSFTKQYINTIAEKCGLNKNLIGSYSYNTIYDINTVYFRVHSGSNLIKFNNMNNFQTNYCRNLIHRNGEPYFE